MQLKFSGMLLLTIIARLSLHFGRLQITVPFLESIITKQRLSWELVLHEYISNEASRKTEVHFGRVILAVFEVQRIRQGRSHIEGISLACTDWYTDADIGNKLPFHIGRKEFEVMSGKNKNKIYVKKA